MSTFRTIPIIPCGLTIESDGKSLTISGTRPAYEPPNLAAAEQLMRAGAALLPGLLDIKEAN